MKKLLSVLLVMTMLLTSVSALAFESDADTFPICEKFGDITLKLLVLDNPAIIDWNTNEAIKHIEAVTNVDLVFETVPYTAPEEKLGVILASGNFPDIFWDCGINRAMIERYGVGEKLFQPLNDLIDKYGVEINKVFEEFPQIRSMITQLDGNIYSLPTINECYHCTMGNKFWINKKWLDNLGLEMPKTLDEYYNVLIAFRDKDANGNGDPNDEIPLAGSYKNGWHMRSDMFITNAFLYDNIELLAEDNVTNDAFGMYLEDGKITTPYAKPEFVEALKFMRKLVEEKLFYEPSFSMDQDQLAQICESGKLGSMGAGWNYLAELGGDIYREYYPLAPVTGPQGYSNTPTYPYSYLVPFKFLISDTCANPEAAVRVADMLYKLENELICYYGPKGVKWEYSKEGAKGINGEQAIYKPLGGWQDSNAQNDHLCQHNVSNRDAKFRMGQEIAPDVDLWSSDGLEVLLYNAAAEMEKHAHHDMVIPPIKFTDAQAEEMAVWKTELSGAIKEGIVAFYTGAKDIDKDLPAFIEDLKGKGLDKLIEMYQAAYDSQYKK